MGANELRDFRPIILIRGVHEFIAKVLAKRLKKGINELVKKLHMAFIKGRQVMHAALPAGEH